MDPRVRKLAENLINFSVALKSDEKVLIRANNPRCYPLAEALVDAAYAAGGLPLVELYDSRVTRAYLTGATTEQLELEERQSLEKMQSVQAFIAFAATENQFILSDVPREQLKLVGKIGKPSLDHRVKHTKWCVLRYPTPAMAQLAEMPNEAFEDFYYSVCLLNYSKMSRAMDALRDLMQKTDRVAVRGAGTNLEFSIKGIPAIKCDGRMNIPDGEVFTAPVRDSVNGIIHFTAPTVYDSKRFGGIRLEFRDGKIVDAHCEQGSEKDMLEILDRDEGARYVGEFAIGVNPLVKKAMLNILFDEKIAGSFHFTPGACYDDAPNGNDSQIHWDMVCIQTPEYGGGQMWFDDTLIRRDGRFVLPELEPLNPENLI